MSRWTSSEIRAAVVDIIAPDLNRAGIAAAALDDKLDLLEGGILDSFAYLDMIMALEQRTGISIDLAAIDDQPIGTVGGLVRAVHELDGEA